MPYLAFNLNDENEFVFDILEERLSIGGDAKNDIIIAGSHIANFHAEFVRLEDGTYELQDLNSGSGTFVNGQRVERTRLKAGDQIRFGQLDSWFRERPASNEVSGMEPQSAMTGKEPVQKQKSSRKTAGPAGTVSGESDKTGREIQALEAQKTELIAAVTQLSQERDALLLAASSTEEAKRIKERTLDESILVKAGVLAALESQVAQLEVNAADLTNKLDDLAQRDAQLSGAAEDHFKSAESQRAELAESIARMEMERDVLIRDLQSATDKGRAQHALNQTLIARQEAAFREALDSEDRQAKLSAELGRVREDLRAAEFALEARQKLLGEGSETAFTPLESHQYPTAELLDERQQEIMAAEARLAELRAQIAGFEERVAEFSAREKSINAARSVLMKANHDMEKAQSEARRLHEERVDHERRLPTLRDEMAQLQHDLAVKHKELEMCEARLIDLRYQVRDMDALLKELKDAEATLENVHLEVTRLTGERDVLNVLVSTLHSERENHEHVLPGLRADVNALRTEFHRLTQDSDSAASALEKAHKNLTMLEESIKASQAQISELVKKAKAEEVRHAEAVSQLEKSGKELQSVELKRVEAVEALMKAREEEKSLRKIIPALNMETAGLKASLMTLARDREEVSQYVSRLNGTIDVSNRKLAELQQQISQLEAAHRLREERVMAAQTEVDNESARLKAAQEQTRAAESVLQDLERQVKEGRQRADAVRAQVTSQDAELSSRLDRVQSLKADEERLNRELAAKQLEIQHARTYLSDLNAKIVSEEKRVMEYTHIGDQVLTLGTALASLETRQSETVRSLGEATELEHDLRMKINALQEAYNRELARVEEVRASRISAESELASLIEKMQKQAASLKSAETKQQKRIAEMENHLREQTAQAEQVKSELAGLQDRRAEFAQAEIQLRHWQEIDARLRGQLIELEEKHEIMRRGLSTHEATVIMFANDLIKRIDLIDALTVRYCAHDSGDVAAQLGKLRASFEDILHQHGVTEFDVDAETKVDAQLRKRIAVVDSLPGKDKPRVIETCRSGFMYSRDDGHEVILRKVEVRTSSQSLPL